jgi:hypothetical protein
MDVIAGFVCRYQARYGAIGVLGQYARAGVKRDDAVMRFNPVMKNVDESLEAVLLIWVKIDME